jgi:hypothetical protein
MAALALEDMVELAKLFENEPCNVTPAGIRFIRQDAARRIRASCQYMTYFD